MTTRRRSLDELRRLVLVELHAEHWTTASAIADRLRVGHGTGWLRVALVLERLANDGDAELEEPGGQSRAQVGSPPHLTHARVRRFRLAPEPRP